jgi:3,4-dihydroxy-2-butanone 4-phosphate synthase
LTTSSARTIVCAAEKVTPQVINFMTRVGGGYLCVALAGEDCDRLELAPQATANTALHGTALTVSVDGHPRHGVGTGVSAPDRNKTIQLLIDRNTTTDDFVRPGHVNPLRARDGGVLVRTGQTEGSTDLARLAGLQPAAALIEIVRDDGEMARMPDLEVLCGEHNLKICSVQQIIEYRLARDHLVERLDPREGTPIETPYGGFNLIAYHSSIDALPHLALTVGGVGDLDGDGRPRQIDEPPAPADRRTDPGADAPPRPARRHLRRVDQPQRQNPAYVAADDPRGGSGHAGLHAPRRCPRGLAGPAPDDPAPAPGRHQPAGPHEGGQRGGQGPAHEPARRRGR